mmetsp:Transcript_38661/g.106500  ORF Transcript_38661/g.106500 Transcript_38661/m.106500 type:complete len:410 (-) Transcript_38661:174-1403(-)
MKKRPSRVLADIGGPTKQSGAQRGGRDATSARALGTSSSESLAPPSDEALLPPFFAEILAELARCRSQLGGVRNFEGAPQILRKVKQKDFASSYTDYEYIYLTVLGFARLHLHFEEIVRRNNGKLFYENPGVQMLERMCGMTMHGDRAGADHLLRSAPTTLLEAFAVARARRNGVREFFAEAFDRSADPCLEGRTSRLLTYLEARRQTSGDTSGVPPWEDVSLRALPPDASARDVVGEHLRVFVGECTWSWSRMSCQTYEVAKARRFSPAFEADFASICNAATFEAAFVAKGMVAKPEEAPDRQWEAITDKGCWNAYEEDINTVIEQARLEGFDSVDVCIGPRGWMYQVDLARMVQRNFKTHTERAIRWAPRSKGASQPARGIPLEELRKEIKYFVDLHTLPATPAKAQ